MITYVIGGCLPSPWEDFLPDNEVAPKVSIWANEPVEFSLASNDGFVDVSIKDSLLTEERAKTILEELTGEPVAIRMMRMCQSV